MRTLFTLVFIAALAGGCTAARSPELFRDDTKQLLDTRSGAIKACYDGILQADAKASGKVTVTFALQKETGKLVDAKVDAANTTAPAPVAKCILSNLDGIVLKPGDRNRGEATWSWAFSAAEAPK